jgi:hypothetical protein
VATFKTVDDLINHILDDKHYANLRFQATENVAKEAVKDIHDGAVSILHSHYYAWRPKKRFKTKKNGGKYKNGGKKKWARGSYTRTYSLEHSFVSSYSVDRKGKNVVCEIGVAYSPSALKDYVEGNNIFAYKGSKRGTEERQWVYTDWVIDNFLEGKHPYTDGSTEPGTPVQYYQDPEERTQWAGMKKMFLRYVGRTLPHAILVEMINLQGR